MKLIKKLSMFFLMIGLIIFAHASLAQSLKDQFLADQNKQVMNKMMKEDRELIKKEQFKRAGIAPEDLKSRGQILKCNLTPSSSDTADEYSGKLGIQRFLNSYVLIDGNIVRYHPNYIDPGPEVRGRLTQAGTLIKTGQVGYENIKWEHDLSSGETFIGYGTKVFKAKCGLTQFRG